MKPKLLLVFLLLLANLTAKSYALGINVVEVPAPNIEFADANVKAICVANWDTNNDGELSEEEAVAVTDLGTVFKSNTQITSFDELQYFTGLTSIGYQAFSGCSGLTSVTIPNSVTSIGNYAFSDCSGLTSINIPNSVTSIGRYAFRNCSGLTSVTIPNSVTSIGDNAFYECFSLTSINIPESVTSIGAFAFAGCSGLTSVTIPESVTSIGEYAFSGCSGLTSVTIPNSVTSIDGAFRGCSGLTSVTIPSSVTSIGNSAFDGCSGLTSVTIPNSVTSIGDRAFSGCSGLTSVTIPNSVTSIGRFAFYGCSGLTSVTIPNSVTSIDGYAFSDCSGLTAVHITDIDAWCKISFSGYSFSNPLYYAHHLYLNGEEVKDLIIPSSVASIGDRAFQGCSGLTSVTIPNSVTSIGRFAFYGCSGLTSVTIDRTQPLSIDSYTFSNRANATLYVPAGSKEAYEAADYWKEFKEIKEIKESNIYFADANVKALCVENWDTDGDGELSEDEAAAVTELGEVFMENEDITSFDELQYFTGLTSIGWYAFSFCRGLTSVTIPNSVTSIGDRAFYDCSGLTSVTIPSSVTSIGTKAFNGCSGLTSVTIPNSVTSIGNSAFSYCSGLTSVIIPSSVTSISGSAFEGCSGLTSVTIPNSVTSIGNSAFSDCSGLTSVTIPNSVTNIGEKAFQGCSGLTSLTIPSSVTIIDDWAFQGCSGLTSVTIPSSVTSICGFAFSDCSGLTSVTIPNSVTSIGEYAFSGCSGLTSVTIPNSVTSIGYGVFSGCSGLTSVIIPNSVTSIGDLAFRDCSGLTSINVAEGNTTYDSRGGCNAIIKTSSNTLIIGCKNTIIPSSVTSIGYYAFYGCSGLISVTIPSSVTSICGYAFRNCSGLTSVTIPESVTSIGEYAFSGCSGLTSVTIPNSVTSIGYDVFSGCSGLTSVVSKIEEPFTFGSSAFSSIASTCTLTVPAGTRDAYIAAGWTENVFKGGVVEAEPEYAYNVSDDITSLATAEWEGKTGDYGGLANASVERYTNGVPEDVGDILTQTISGLRNGTYRVQLEAAASFTSGRGFECPTGDDLSVVFANGTQRNLPVLDRVAVREGEQKLVTLTATVTDGTLKYGIKNLAPSGNWFVARLKSIVYVSADAQFPQTYAISIAPEENGTTTTDVTADEEGSRVFISAIPDEGYVLESLTVTTTNEQDVEMTNNWFIMPASAVTVTATYILRQPFDGELTLPGTLEAENYDIGGEGFAYHDNEPENQGDGNYRQNEGVDIVACNDGYAVGWTNEGEWIEYTVNVSEAGKYTYEATVSSGVKDGGGFSISLVGEDGSLTTLADVSVPQTSDWETYQTVTGELLQELTTGTQIIRITCTTANCNIDKVKFDWNNIEFADANVKAICVANWDTDNDGKLSMEEAAAVTDLGEVFKENTTITSFDELQYFTGLESICNEAFNGCSNLTSVVLPEGLKNINHKSFCSTGLKSIKFPASLEWAGTYAFINTPLESIDFNGCAATFDMACFQGNHVEDLYIPNTVKFVGYNNLAWSWLKHVTFEAFEEEQESWNAALLFAGCTNLESVVLPTTAVMEDNFFEECRGLTSITFLKVEDNFDIMTKNYARMLGGVPYTNYVKVNIPEGYAEQFLRAGYYNLSDLSGLPFAREEFESEAARISSMAEQLSSGDMQALTTAISNARTIVNAAEEYLTIYAQINAIKDAAKIYVNSTNLTKGDDLTAAYILNPDFDRFQFGWSIFSGWDSRGVKFGDSGSGDVVLENFVEALCGGGLGEGQIAQTITNLPAGIYRLEMDAQADTWSEEVPVTGTTFFAGTSSTSVSTKPYYPEHFSVRFENPATQSVTVGINLANSNAKYVSADNFRLYYEGEVAPPPAGTELVSSEDDTYYIYNVEAGMFLNAGNSWGTHAVLAETGLPVRMTQDSDGYWEIFFRKGSTNQQKLFVTDDNNEVYVDWADGVPPRWQIAPLDGSYTIQYMSDEGTSYVLGNDPNRQDFDWQNNTTRDTHIDVIRTNNATNHTRWQFIKATDYDLAMAKRQLFATICRMEQSDVDNDDLLSNGEAIYYDANATLAEVIEAITLLNSQMGMPKENAPVDMTAMIINPAFEKNTTEGWTDATRGCTDSRVQEFKQNFNMYQQVVGVPNGRYRLKYKGFHRAGSEMGPASAVVYANDVQKTLKHICDGASDTQLQGWDELSYDGQYIPGGQGAARKYFDAGLYADYLEVEVTDNILTIGVKNTEEMGANHWVCFSDFELEILENAEQLENRLIVEDCRGISGGKATMKIAMENVADVAGLEFKVKLPEGVNFDLVGGTPKVSKTSRMTGMIVSTSLIGDYAKVLVIPKLPEEEGAPLPVVTGNSGTIANFVLTIGNSLELGDYELEVKDIIIGKSDGLMIKQISSAKATLTLVNAGQGDANRDSNVDVGDIITIANTILGNPPANFDAAAADVNGDGDINVGDIIALANIILRGGEEFDPQ